MKINEMIEIDGIFYPTVREATQKEAAEIERQVKEAEEAKEKAFWSLSYEERVSVLIREKYSLDDELALSRQRDTKQAEFSEYFTFCEECKRKAKGIDDSGQISATQI